MNEFDMFDIADRAEQDGSAYEAYRSINKLSKEAQATAHGVFNAEGGPILSFSEFKRYVEDNGLAWTEDGRDYVA